MENKLWRETRADQVLAEDNFNWKDMVIFALDDYLEEMLTGMVQEGSLGELDENEISELATIIESRTRDAMGSRYGSSSCKFRKNRI